MNRVFSDAFVAVEVDLDHGVTVGGDDVELLAVARDRHSARNGITRGVVRLDHDLGVGLELARAVLKGLDRPAVGGHEKPLAVGGPENASEAGVGAAERDLRTLSDTLAIKKEYLGFVQDGENVARRMQGDVAWPSVEGNRARLDPLAGRHKKTAVGLLAHPDDPLTRGSGDDQDEQGQER